MENDRFVIPHVLYRLLYMRKSPITRIRTYILNIYACGNWKAREIACRFSPTIYTKGFKPAKPHVRFPSWMAKHSNNSANYRPLKLLPLVSTKKRRAGEWRGYDSGKYARVPAVGEDRGYDSGKHALIPQRGKVGKECGSKLLADVLNLA